MIVAVAVGNFSAAKGGHAGRRSREHDLLVLQAKSAERNVEPLWHAVVQPDSSGCRRGESGQLPAPRQPPGLYRQIHLLVADRSLSSKGTIFHARYSQTDGGARKGFVSPCKHRRQLINGVGVKRSYVVSVFLTSFGTCLSTLPTFSPSDLSQASIIRSWRCQAQQNQCLALMRSIRSPSRTGLSYLLVFWQSWFAARG